MNIEYVGRNFPLDDPTRDFAALKLAKLERFLEEPAEARLILELDRHRHIAELHVTHRFGIVQASEASDDMRNSIHAVVEKAERQAREGRKRAQDRRRRSGRDGRGHWPVDVLEGESMRSGAGPLIIKSSRLQIKPMSLEEAALQLEDGRHDFVVFRDATTDLVSVLYRRRDNNYGLIAPEF